MIYREKRIWVDAPVWYEYVNVNNIVMCQSWALSVFFYFFHNKNPFFASFIKLITYF